MTSALHTLGRSYLVHEPDWTYRFGPPTAPLLVLNAPDAYGCEWICDEPEGWAAPTAVTPLDARQWGDGSYAGATTYETRTLSFGSGATGVCVAPDRPAAHAALRRLLDTVTGRTPVLYTQDGYPAQSLWLRSSGQPKIAWIGEDAFQFAFVMVADDPIKFDAAQFAAPLSTHLPQPAGAVYPWLYPSSYGAGATGTVLVTNAGDEAAQAVYTIAGPTAPNLPPLAVPTVTNTATGVRFTIARTLYLNDRVVVDTRAGTVQLNGTDVFGDFAGDFPLIIPGPNPVTWGAQSPIVTTAPTDQDAQLTVAASSAWR
jgi:hypothetical protein